ncbi:MAG: hypothetical protein J0L75_19470 [Spirochaetes bacterium]|nr:hypothetical protein [Spirochaetota bacterium]
MRRLLLALLIPATALGAPSGAKSDIYKKIQAGVDRMITEFKAKDSKAAERGTNAFFLAVVDFDNVGPDAKKLELGGGLAEMVSVQAGKSPAVKIVDRKRMKTIMKELALSESGVVDGASAKQTGRILAADVILSGSVSRLGGTLSVALRLVDVETAQQVSATTVELPVDQVIPMAHAASLESKYPITAAFRSLSVPGWGHFYNDQPAWGTLYMVTTAAALAGAIYTTVDYENAKRIYNLIDYNNFRDYYPAALTAQDAAGLAYEDAELRNQLRQAFWIATGALWVANVVHAGVAASAINAKIKRNTYHPTNPAIPVAFWLAPTTDGAAARLTWSF